MRFIEHYLIEENIDQTETPEFKHWFGGSKVVDKYGNPLVVYHGTDKDFDKFSKSKIGSNHWESGNEDKGGFFFTDKKRYAHHGGIVKDVYLNIQNPLIQTVEDYYWATDKYDLNSDDYLDRAIENGNDGIIFKSPSGSLFIVFNPNQIKSATGNKGTFDFNSDNINEALPKDETIKKANEIIDIVYGIHRDESDFEDDEEETGLANNIDKYNFYKLTNLKISDIGKHHMTYDDDRVKLIMKQMKMNSDYPPIVYDDDIDLIVDGVHRIEALKKLGVDNVRAWVGFN